MRYENRAKSKRSAGLGRATLRDDHQKMRLERVVGHEPGGYTEPIKAVRENWMPGRGQNDAIRTSKVVRGVLVPYRCPKMGATPWPKM